MTETYFFAVPAHRVHEISTTGINNPEEHLFDTMDALLSECSNKVGSTAIFSVVIKDNGMMSIISDGVYKITTRVGPDDLSLITMCARSMIKRTSFKNSMLA